jgi:transposase
MLRQWPWTSQKTVFELAIANEQWRVVSRRRLNRKQFTQFLAETPATHVVMEACGMAHYWGRVALQHGHRVSLIPPAYVRPYVHRNTADRTDAEALLEAVRSGQIPTVPVKRVGQQALISLHRVREQWMTTRTARLNTVRGLLRELGVLLPAGPRAALRALPAVLDAATGIPQDLRHALTSVHEDVRAIETRLLALAGADAARALQRRAAPTRRHQQARQCLPASRLMAGSNRSIRRAPPRGASAEPALALYAHFFHRRS